MKKLLYLLSAMALMAGFTACEDSQEQPGPDLGGIVLDGFYIYGEAVGTNDLVDVNALSAGMNENGKMLRTGMYEKYIWLEADKDFRMVEYSAGTKIHYGANLAEENYGWDENDPDCKNFGDNPNMKIQVGEMIVGEEAPAMQVKETGMYHIVLDNNYVGDLEYPQILVQRAKWGVRGGMNNWGFTEGVETRNADGSIIYTWSKQILSANGEFKFASCDGWKINLDLDGNVKAEVSFGMEDGKLINGTDSNIKVSKDFPAVYNLTLIYKPKAGALGDSFTFVEEYLTELPSATTLVDGEANVKAIPVNGKGGRYWVAYYLDANKTYKLIKSISAGDTAFTTLDGAPVENITVEGDGFKVAQSGLYRFYVDYVDNKVAVDVAEVCGMGDAFGGWNAGQYPFTVEDGVATIQTAAAGNLRMYVAVPNAEWWQTEFNIYDGKIVYRGNDGDQAAVAVTAGQTVTLNFNEGTGSIQ